MKKYGFGGFVFDENIILMKYINVNDGNMYEKMLNVDVIFGGCCCSWWSYNARGNCDYPCTICRWTCIGSPKYDIESTLATVTTQGI